MASEVVEIISPPLGSGVDAGNKTLSFDDGGMGLKGGGGFN